MWLVAAASAIVAILYMRRSAKHTQKKELLVQEAKRLEKDTAVSVQKSLAAQKKARAASLRAAAAHNESEARIHEIEDRNKSMGERLRAYRDRRSRRMRERDQGA